MAGIVNVNAASQTKPYNVRYPVGSGGTLTFTGNKETVITLDYNSGRTTLEGETKTEYITKDFVYAPIDSVTLNNVYINYFTRILNINIPKDAKGISLVIPIYPKLALFGSNTEYTDDYISINASGTINLDKTYLVIHDSGGTGAENVLYNVKATSASYFSAFGLIVTFDFPDDFVYVKSSNIRSYIYVDFKNGQYNLNLESVIGSRYDNQYYIGSILDNNAAGKPIFYYTLNTTEDIKDAVDQLLDVTEGGFSDVNENLEGLQATLDLIHQGQEVTNEKLEEIKNGLFEPSEENQGLVDDLRDKYTNDKDRVDQMISDLDLPKPNLDIPAMVSNITSYLDFTWLIAYLRISYDQPVMVAVYAVLGVVLIFGYLLYGKKH